MDRPSDKQAPGSRRAGAAGCVTIAWMAPRLCALMAVVMGTGVAAVVLELVSARAPGTAASAEGTSSSRPPCLIELALVLTPQKGSHAGVYRALYSDPGGPTHAHDKVVHECAFDREDQLTQALSACENWTDHEKRTGFFTACVRIQKGVCDPALPAWSGNCAR